MKYPELDKYRNNPAAEEMRGLRRAMCAIDEMKAGLRQWKESRICDADGRSRADELVAEAESLEADLAREMDSTRRRLESYYERFPSNSAFVMVSFNVDGRRQKTARRMAVDFGDWSQYGIPSVSAQTWEVLLGLEGLGRPTMENAARVSVPADVPYGVMVEPAAWNGFKGYVVRKEGD